MVVEHTEMLVEYEKVWNETRPLMVIEDVSLAKKFPYLVVNGGILE